MLKSLLSSLSTQFSGQRKECSYFKPKAKAFTLTQSHVSTPAVYRHLLTAFLQCGIQGRLQTVLLLKYLKLISHFINLKESHIPQGVRSWAHFSEIKWDPDKYSSEQLKFSYLLPSHEGGSFSLSPSSGLGTLSFFQLPGLGSFKCTHKKKISP